MVYRRHSYLYRQLGRSHIYIFWNIGSYGSYTRNSFASKDCNFLFIRHMGGSYWGNTS